MASALDLRGVYIPLVTPFDASDAVDREAIERLCHEYLDAGAAGIVALGTTAETATLDTEERALVVALTSGVCAERNAPLIVGAGTNSTKVTLDLVAALAAFPAVVGSLVVVPYYTRPSEAAIVEHFKAVAAQAPHPVVIYNIPYRTGRGLGSASLLELAAVPGIAGVKQAVGALDSDTLRVLAGRPEGFHLVGGDDPYIYPTTLMGGSGAICASAHVCTEQFVSMIDCALAGKVEEGRRTAESLLPVVEALFAEPNPAVAKAVLHVQGRIASPSLRAPMADASPEALERALAAIDAVTA